MSRTLRILLAAFFFTYPLMNLGIVVSGYPFSVPLVMMLILDAAILLGISTGYLPVRADVLLSTLVFGIYILLVTFAQGQLATSVLSLGLLLLMLIPFLTPFPGGDLRVHSQLWFLRGQHLNALICIASILMRYGLNLNLDEIIPVMIPQRTTPILGDLYRINGLMIEPSLLAIYLVFGIVINDSAPIRPSRKTRTQALLLALLILTGSLSGFVPILAYMFLKVLLRLAALRPKIRKHELRKHMVTGLVLGATVMIVLIATALNIVDTIVLLDYVSYRAERVTRYLKSGDFYSSEGVRLSAIPIAWQYVREGRVFGEGYHGAVEWLQANTWLTDGNIHNLYAYVAIAFGVPGLVLFVILVFSIACHIGKRGIWIFPIWGLLGFATGHLILYYVWGYLLLFTITAGTHPATGVQQFKPSECHESAL